MTTLITGAGLIGCQTASLLVARGEKPVLLDLRPSPDAIRSVLPDGAVIVEAGDVRDRAAMLGLFKRHSIDKVLHTAAALSLAIRQTPSLAAEVNIGGTVNLLDAARDVGARRWRHQRCNQMGRGRDATARLAAILAGHPCASTSRRHHAIESGDLTHRAFPTCHPTKETLHA